MRVPGAHCGALADRCARERGAQALKARKKHDDAVAIAPSYDGYQVLLGLDCSLAGAFGLPRAGIRTRASPRPHTSRVARHDTSAANAARLARACGQCARARTDDSCLPVSARVRSYEGRGVVHLTSGI
jgi:hypothetical protein